MNYAIAQKNISLTLPVGLCQPIPLFIFLIIIKGLVDSLNGQTNPHASQPKKGVILLASYPN